MRLRSSKFVFLLLLVCSAQNRQEIALHLLAGASAEQTTSGPRQHEMHLAIARRSVAASLPFTLPVRKISLEPAAVAAHKVVWSMRRPALASVAVSSFTGFLRA